MTEIVAWLALGLASGTFLALCCESKDWQSWNESQIKINDAILDFQTLTSGRVTNLGREVEDLRDEIRRLKGTLRYGHFSAN